MFRHAAVAALVLTTVAAAARAQVASERERARPHYRTGWEFMRIEAWPEAAKSFLQAVDVDPQFEDAYYSLGRAYMNQKTYVDAINAYTRSRDLYRANAGKSFTNQQEAQRYRADRLTELDDVIRQLQSGPQTAQIQDQIRRAQEQRRQIQQYIQRGANMSIENSVPAFVSLALGSAYFRAGKLTDAEREYRAALASDPKTGEAHNNLAVVYLQTERFADAEREIGAAERLGYKVHPQLKKDITDGMRNKN
jgi:tetratricopeptide (TPR) repeat protein